MAGLFDLPTSRSNKKSDGKVINRASNKKASGMVLKGGGMLEKIASINSIVEAKLGKYKDQYEYYMADDEVKFTDYINSIIESGYCSLDTETTGLNPMQDKIVGLSLYTKGQKGLYIPIHHKSYVTGLEVEGQLESKFIAEKLKLMVDKGTKVKGYNAKFDRRVIRHGLGVDVPFWFDAHLAAMCLDENEQHGLKRLHSKYVLDGKEDEFAFDKLFSGITFDLVPIKTGYIYAARDAVDTDELVDFQLPFLTKDDPLCIEYGLQDVVNVFWNIEMPCSEVLTDMEDTGVAFDLEYSNELSEKYNALKTEKLNNFYEILDLYKDKIESYKAINPNHKLSDPILISSTTQLAILLYDILKIEPVDDKSPRGTGDEILRKIDNPLTTAIQEYRKVDKLLSTYIDKLPDCIDPNTGRIHCSLNQYGAKTGRMSSENPNLQNIPSHNKDIRKMFIASPGYVMMSADFSQQEPKVMTAMCQDPSMIQAYREGKDLYASIASLAFNVPYRDCLEFYTNDDGSWKLDEHGERITYKAGKERRSSAKSILLGILYGRGINSVAEQLNTTKQKAQQIQDKVFKGFPAIKRFEEDTIRMAQEYGFVTTFWGRKRRLPEMQLDEFEFKWRPGFGDVDPLSFDSDVVESEVPYELQKKYINKLHRNPFKKRPIFEEANNEGIWIVDNGGKIADATRQCVNSRIQGSAADMTKIAGSIIHGNARLKELGFRLLIPIHDEYLAECPIENAKECAKIFSDCMCKAAESLNLPISCDVEITDRWYGDEVVL